ncbi:MAG TPA: hypothetical protein DCL44_02655 [Elusimicrobia bacterium]|nr:hypothetical protein [Elusimicrobiota bacterium]
MALKPEDIPVQELLPHRWPAIMIDALLEACPERGVAAKTFRRQDYGLDGDAVCESALVECVAQTTAAFFGYNCRSKPGGSGLGFLAGLSSFSFSRRARVNEPLVIEAQVIRALGPMFIVKGRVLAGQESVAEGEIKIYLQNEKV